MSDDVVIREGVVGDAGLIGGLYPLAFPAEDLLPLARDLLADRRDVLSLVAVRDGELAGHAAFTLCGVEGDAGAAALLGPLAVLPAMQRRGVGSALVRAGLQRLKAEGVAQVQVLGDPAYYGRFGFRPDDGVASPYPLPEAWRGAWQAISLRGGAPALRGRLLVPEPWRHPALWEPPKGNA